MDLYFILFFFGFLLFLYLIAALTHTINRSKPINEWFVFLLNLTGKILAYFAYFILHLCILLFSMFIVYALAYYPLTWAEQHLPLSWNYVLIALTFLYFFFWIWWTGTKHFYLQFSYVADKSESANKPAEEVNARVRLKAFIAQLMRNFRKIVPLMVIIGLVMLVIIWFSAFTAALNRSGCISFSPALVENGLSSISDFYLWYFFDLIPQIKVNQTLNWDVPFKYSQGGIAALLLFFKILMAYIVIGRFYTWNKWRKATKKESSGNANTKQKSKEKRIRRAARPVVRNYNHGLRSRHAHITRR